MSHYRSTSRLSLNENSTDDPPMSRLFVICNKTHTEEDFREAFSQFGTIEDIWVVKNKSTGENKGIAYIKFSRTLEAARAQEAMNGQSIGDSDRSLKVLVAANRSQGSGKAENEEEKYLRLFIVIPKTSTEEAIREEFEKFGEVDHVSIVKDRTSGLSKGFAYVKFRKFVEAATAFEKCPENYRAVFAEPKSSITTRNTNNTDRYNSRYDDPPYGGRSSARGGDNYGRGGGGGGSRDDFLSNLRAGGGNSEMINFLCMERADSNQPTCLEVICSNLVNQDQLWRLFDIIPGLDYCQFTRERGPRTFEAIAVYNNPEAAIYAKEKIHGLEYPPGERVIVKIAGLDNVRVENSSALNKQMKKDSLCNVPLPPAQPLADPDAPLVDRCFIVLSSGLPHMILKNVFCCFGSLIDVYLLPNKNCGYVKYANAESAMNAIQTLNGAEVCGVRMKVMKAEDPVSIHERKRKRSE